MKNINDLRKIEMIVNALNSHVEKLTKIDDENRSVDKQFANIVIDLKIEYLQLWEEFMLEKNKLLQQF